jgi:hypothetical protein
LCKEYSKKGLRFQFVRIDNLKCDKPIKTFLGRSKRVILNRLKKDRYLNNIPLKEWDSSASVFLMYNRSAGLSLAEVVCMLKHLAPCPSIVLHLIVVAPFPPKQACNK